MVNVKVFRNGKLQLTGLKFEDEAITIGNLLIGILNHIKVPVNLEVDNILQAPATFDLQLVWDGNRASYFRRYYNRFLKNFKFNLEEQYMQNILLKAGKVDIYSQIKLDIKRKNFIKDVHDKYYDNSVYNSKLQKLEENEWFCDRRALEIIDMINYAKNLFETEANEILDASSTIKQLRDELMKLKGLYLDFRCAELNGMLDSMYRGYYAFDEQTLLNVKSEIRIFIKNYKQLLDKKINRLLYIRNSDISICDSINKYITLNHNKVLHEHNKTINSHKQLILTMSELHDNPIYQVSNVETVMINSDLTVNYNINLKKMAKILKKKELFNTYDPDEHSAVNLKYYWNQNNIIQGFCHCIPHCSTKEKKSICSKITILIFRPGSIIITGSRTINQLKAAHEFTINLLKETMIAVRVDENIDDSKRLALLNNEHRKISKKPRLFFIRKDKLQIPV
jgi:TATA-box binding protein (TBP) (component of TFIID and TFIIIB)